MSLFRTNWTPAEADEWNRHDFWACVFSVAAYVLIMIGMARAFLLQWDGYVMLVGAAVCMVVMYKIIDPKLRVLSTDFEKKQQAYLDRLERQVRWEDTDG